LPVIRREGIEWSGGIGGAPLEIRLKFENPSTVRTTMATARVEVAAFGAFVPWNPLTAVAVPPIPPDGRVAVTATVDLPDPDDTPQLLAQMQNARSPDQAMGAMAALLRVMFQWKDRDQLEMHPVHFVGNLNVFVTPRRAVERHQQRAIGLQPGHANFTLFFVGDHRQDSYSLRHDAEPGWDVQLSDWEWDRAIRIRGRAFPIAITPPPGVEYGRIAIWVKRHSTGEEVPVEFELATDAKTLACGTVVG
jgi:hypothetical protein